MKNFEHYRKAIYFLEGLSNLPQRGDYIVDRQHLGVYLKRMRYLLNLVGNPDRGMKFIHIAGTAGKGTVTNMVHEALHVAHKKVGSFTSPFVTTSIEKIKYGDKYISPDEFADIVDELKPILNRMYLESPYGRASYFEIFLVIALIYFKRQKCEWVVLEVGLGGRFDATNVIEKPVITVITNIDYDHMEVLGNTLKKIGYDKAGIIKSSSVFFTSEQRPDLLKMFKKICNEKKVTMNKIPRQKDYQESNKALAHAITEAVGIKESDRTQGINQARLQCRFEIMQTSPYVVLDGAHNRAKIRTSIENLKKIDYKKLHLIIGISESKDTASILKYIIPLAHTVAITRFQIKDRKCAQPKELLEKAKKYMRQGAKIEMGLDPEVILDNVLKHAKKEDVVLCAGSFFLAGELRKKWFREDWILAKRKIF